MSENEESLPSSPLQEENVGKENGDEPKDVNEKEVSEPAENLNESKESISDDDEDEDGGKEKKAALYEQPIVIEGKRERKKTERLSEKIAHDQEESEKAKEIIIQTGKGTALGEIEYVQYHMNRIKAEDLKLLHRICFGRAGHANEVKKNIRKFSGFPFERDSKEHEKKMDIINRMFMPVLKQMLEWFGLERKGNKDDLTKRLIDFLYEPTKPSKKVPQPKKGKSKGEKRKRKSKGKSDKKSKKSDGSSSGDSGSESESNADEPEDKEETVKEKEEKPKKEKKEKAPPKKKPKVEKEKKATPAKKKEPKKKVEKKLKPEDLIISSDSDSDSDDEPLVKKKKPPTDEELRSVIRKFLDGADLEQVTMKTVCKDVYAKYPDFDLTDRKSFIKATVKEIIN